MPVDAQAMEAIRENPAAAAALLRSSFRHFVAVFHRYMWNSPFCFRPFHHEIIRKLEGLAFGTAEKQRLYIGMAPRFGKTQLCIYFFAWSYALNPGCNFIAASYGDTLIVKISRQARAIVESELFQLLFGVHVKRGSSAAELWSIEGGGEFRAATIGGVITGFGAGSADPGYGGALVIDDFMKADDSRSESLKRGVIDSYNTTLKSRLNSPHTPVIIIAQRLAVDDLIGYIEETEAELWDFFLLPTLDEDSGRSIWEEKMPAEALLRIKDISPGTFYAQYQQTPIIAGGEVFRSEWWSFYPTGQTFAYRRIYICADTAMKTGEANDFTAIGVFGLSRDGEIHLLDMDHGKYEAPELQAHLLAIYQKWRYPHSNIRCSAVYIEDKASGTGLLQTLRRQGMPVLPIKPDRDKYTRAMDAVPYIANGAFKLPDSREHPISRKVIAEAEAFRSDMRHKHDDIVDMLAYGITKSVAGTGIF